MPSAPFHSRSSTPEAHPVVKCENPPVMVVSQEPMKKEPESVAVETVTTEPSSSTEGPGPRVPPIEPFSRSANMIGQLVSHDILLGRWRLTLDLFGRVFVDDVGAETSSIISELGGFPVKEAKFRREMEKLRNSHQRDLTLSKIERERGTLLQQTFKELNTHYQNYERRTPQTYPPLTVNRVKVTFKDEPGEGSGVARSFYTAIAEVFR